MNNELNEVDYAMRLAQYYLRPQGVLVAISFHSLEDTIIKRHLQGVAVFVTSYFVCSFQVFMCLIVHLILIFRGQNYTKM